MFFAFHLQLELLRINFAYLSSTMFLDQLCHRWVTIECSSADNQGLDRYYYGITACSSLAKKTRTNHPINQMLSWNHHGWVTRVFHALSCCLTFTLSYHRFLWLPDFSKLYQAPKLPWTISLTMPYRLSFSGGAGSVFVCFTGRRRWPCSIRVHQEVEVSVIEWEWVKDHSLFIPGRGGSEVILEITRFSGGAWGNQSSLNE